MAARLWGTTLTNAPTSHIDKTARFSWFHTPKHSGSLILLPVLLHGSYVTSSRSWDRKLCKNREVFVIEIINQSTASTDMHVHMCIDFMYVLFCHNGVSVTNYIKEQVYNWYQLIDTKLYGQLRPKEKDTRMTAPPPSSTVGRSTKL